MNAPDEIYVWFGLTRNEFNAAFAIDYEVTVNDRLLTPTLVQSHGFIDFAHFTDIYVSGHAVVITAEGLKERTIQEIAEFYITRSKQRFPHMSTPQPIRIAEPDSLLQFLTQFHPIQLMYVSIN